MATVPASSRSTTYTLASDSAGPFLVGFRIFDETLTVYVNGALRTDYTVTATFVAGFDDDASITFNASLDIDDEIRIDGNMPISRADDYLNPDPNLTRKVNIEQGRVWAGMQQIKRDADRSTASLTTLDIVAVEATAAAAQLAAAVFAGVRAFGAVGDGSDATAAFSAAAQAAIALDTMGLPNNTSTVPRSDTCSVIVPAGEYTLTDVVDVGNQEITWLLDPGAKITGSDYLNGRTTRAGLKITHGRSYGILDSNAGFTVTLGGDYSDKPAPISGVEDVAALADYTQIDGVATVSAAYSRPPLLTLASGVVAYTETTLTITPEISANNRKRLRKGQVIVTEHGTPYIGVIESWATVAGDTVITLGDGGWYERGDGAAGPQTPAAGSGCLVDVVEKLWAQNLVLNLTADGSANSGIGSELSCRNLGKPSGTDLDTGSRTWGYGALAAAYDTPGFEPSQAGFVARGWWHYGFAAQDQDQGFRYQTTGADKTAFFSRMPFGETILYAEDTTNGRRYRINANGDTEHGDPAVATGGGRSILFHTSGLGSAFDARINATGGTGTQGQGTLTFNALDNIFGGVVRPGSDNTRTLGNASFRWSVVYAGTGTINTSDERDKTDIGPIPDEWLDAWGDVDWVRYRWKEAVAEKGDAARWHVGLIAQAVEKAFRARGLDAFEIGILCKDEIIETVTVTEQEERPVMEELEVEDYLDEVIDGRIVHRTFMKPVLRAKTVTMDVVDEAGKQLWEDVPDPDAPPDTRRRIKIPMRRAMPVTETVDVHREERRPTGEYRYGLRYSEAFAMEAAWVRRALAVEAKKPKGGANAK